MKNIVSVELVTTKIFELRSKKVMVDSDLAKLYGVATKNLNRAVKRNNERFPDDFMFQLTKDELKNLRFQIGTSKRGGRRYLPYVFTQEGVAMLSSVLNSKRAIQVNILIMRAFVKLKELLFAHKDLAAKINALEKKCADHDKKIKNVFDAIRLLIQQPGDSKRLITGFKVVK